MKRLLSLTLCIILLGSVSAMGAGYDYSDATGYATANHSNPSWQRLGKNWDSEAAPKAADTSDDGVFWSVDGGSTWGHDVITAGSMVTFRFDMYKQLWGNHSYDALRAWIDFNNDKDFTDAGELIEQAQWNFTQADSNINNPLYYSKGTNYKAYVKGDNTADITKFFYQDVTFASSMLGDYWLRARVACNFDINSNFNNLTTTGLIGQGEVEDWKLTVVSAPNNPVPEPATMFLLGTGLIGLVSRRKMKK